MGSCFSDCFRLWDSSGYETIPDENPPSCARSKAWSMSDTPGSSNAGSTDDSDYSYQCVLPNQFREKYMLGRLIGQGTTSEVYQVRLNSTDQFNTNPPLACKLINKRAITAGLQGIEFDPNEIQIWREVEILKQIRHPNIVRYYDFYETSEHLFIITERLDGGELYEHIVNHGALTESVAQSVLYGVFCAVAYLHERDIVHRDIKAENLIFFKDANGQQQLKLIDFGFSTIVEQQSTGSFLGTGGYIAPEIRQNKFYTNSVDMWSLGVLLYCTISARLPFGISLETLPSELDECRKAFKLEFPAKLFGHVSTDCKSLIRLLLELRAENRITAREAVNHPWFKEVRERQRHSSPHSIRTLALESQRTTPSPAPFPTLLECENRAVKTQPSLQAGLGQSSSLFDSDPRSCVNDENVAPARVWSPQPHSDDKSVVSRARTVESPLIGKSSGSAPREAINLLACQFPYMVAQADPALCAAPTCSTTVASFDSVCLVTARCTPYKGRAVSSYSADDGLLCDGLDEEKN